MSVSTNSEANLRHSTQIHGPKESFERILYVYLYSMQCIGYIQVVQIHMYRIHINIYLYVVQIHIIPYCQIAYGTIKLSIILTDTIRYRCVEHYVGYAKPHLMAWKAGSVLFRSGSRVISSAQPPTVFLNPTIYSQVWAAVGIKA